MISITKTICKAESLIDIAPLGKATQSSLSKWSKPNDAQRAVTDIGNANFAFHTNKEQNPWWQLTLDKPRCIEYIILHNRKDACKEKSRKLTVELFDGEEYIKIYDGDLLFDAEPDGLPLVLPCKYPKEIKLIKIVSQINEYFHLSKVNALAKHHQLTFIAMRSDGFGERLKAILNAMVLSENFDGRFLFHWFGMSDNKHHAIVEVDEIFSENFINKFHIDRTKLNKMKLIDLMDIAKSSTWIVSEYIKEHDAIIVQQNISAQLLKDARVDIDFANRYKEVFNEIELSESLEYVKTYANSIQLREHPVAIHLRAGDIIYGIHRIMGDYTRKVVSFSIAEKLIRDLLQQGYSPVLFGQDEKLLEYFKDKFGVMLSCELSNQSFSITQQAFFDIVLMSRCEQIFAGTSGFATVASWIGGCQLIDPFRKFTKEESLEIIDLAFKTQKFDDRISSLQKAFACWSYFYIYGEKCATNKKLWKFLNLAIKYDSENDFYYLILACSFYNGKRIEDAEKILYERFLIADKQIYSIIKVLSRPGYLGKVLTISLYIDGIKPYAKLGHPMAALCMAICKKALGNNDSYVYFKELYLKNRSEKYSIFDKYIT
ncbi:MAG: discoidin domain-containing protein [Campylobacteraceae bacterium]|jgi:hypothetical protein|nr:discoidin domain-containing protein [Campylobacteraceae bacterium]